jgi:hypothetical protein
MRRRLCQSLEFNLFMLKKFRWLAVQLLWLGSVGYADDLPKGFPLSRYDGMLEKSPFALATVPLPAIEASQTKPSFAQELYVTGVAKLRGGDFVTLSSRDQQTRFSLVPGQVSVDGISLASVAWSGEPGRTTVTLRKGREFGVVGFDETAMQPQNSGTESFEASISEESSATGNRAIGRSPFAVKQTYPQHKVTPPQTDISFSGVNAQNSADQTKQEANPQIRQRPRIIRQSAQ